MLKIFLVDYLRKYALFFYSLRHTFDHISSTFLLEVNQPIALAHAMKEQIRLFRAKQTIKEEGRFLTWWIMDAVESGVNELEKTGKILLRHWKGLVNYFKHPITNGKTEGINNKIKTMKR